MASKIIMPKQGLQMTEGLITAWLKQEGERVSPDEPLFEMETDKLAITIQASVEGTLLKILHPAGEMVAVAQTIAIVGAPGEDYHALLPEQSRAPVLPAAVAAAASRVDRPISPRAKRLAQARGLDCASISGTGPDGMIIERDLDCAAARQASPLAKKLAEQHGIELVGLSGSGTGPRGKIMAQDVQSPCVCAPEAAQAVPSRSERMQRLSSMRRVIAQRMCQSLHTMAQANHRISVDMSEAVSLRKQLQDCEIKISYNDILLRCVARALCDCPWMNASYTEEGIVFKEYVNLGVAVALEEGLVVPVIKDADLMSLIDLTAASKNLVAKARANLLSSDALSGGTFTVTNLGMMDIDDFTPIINPPEVGILGVGKLEKRVVVSDDNTMVVRPIMRLSLTYDHRAVDGAPAARFLQRLKQLLEHPMLLL